MDIIDIFLFILLLIILGVLFFERKFSYWSRKNISCERPSSWIFGSVKDVYYCKENSAIIFDNIYRKFSNSSYCGFYEFQNPNLMIRDPKLIQTVLIEKFNSFQRTKFSEGVNSDSNEIFALNPFIAIGDQWKELRSTISTGITLNKLRILDDIIRQVFKDTTKYIKNDEDIEAYDLARKYTGSMVAVFGWGISGEEFSANDSPIKKLLDMNQFIDNGAVVLQNFFPFLSKLLRIKLYSDEFTDFFLHLTDQALKIAEEKGKNQSTFINHLLSVREKLRQSGKDLTAKQIAAHMNTFQLDAYETLARQISLVIQYLMMYPEIQQRLREEINTEIEEISIDFINKLQYMEMFLSEVARVFPIAPHYGRICTESCKLGTLDVDEGTRVVIPVYSIHFDPKYYPDPEKFDPERFSEENKNKRPKFTHFTFGLGPRQCPGMKYALGNLKMFLCHLLKEYEILPPSHHEINHMEHDPKSPLFFIPKSELYLKFRRIS